MTEKNKGKRFHSKSWDFMGWLIKDDGSLVTVCIASFASFASSSMKTLLSARFMAPKPSRLF